MRLWILKEASQCACGLLVAGALAFHWVDTRGIGNWTDDWERVPAKFRPTAEEVELKPLADYSRLTCMDNSCPGEQAKED